MALDFGNKVENGGIPPNGVLPASEFNQLVAQVNKNEEDIAAIGTPNSIESIEATESQESGGNNVIKITETNGTETSFNVKNGNDGANGVSLGDVEIADNLTTNDAKKVLSAKQGKVLKDLIDSQTFPIVNNLTEGGEESALSAEQGVELREAITLLVDALAPAAFWNGRPEFNWGTKASIVNNLVDVTSNNSAKLVSFGSEYQATLSYDITKYARIDVAVVMGGVDITSSVYSGGVIDIPNVTGNIVITATAEVGVVIFADVALNSNGNVVPSSGKSVTDFIPMGKCRFVWSAGGTGNSSNPYNVCFYDGNKNYIGHYYGTESMYRIIDITSMPWDVHYVRITFKSDKINTRIFYDITNGKYIFRGADYDGRLDGFEWGYYVSPTSATAENKLADNAWALTKFIEIPNGSTSIKVYAGSTDSAKKLAMYDVNKAYKDYYGHTPDPRTITNQNLGTTWKFLRNSIPLNKIDDCYVKDEINNTYLFKGFNVN